MTIKFIILVCFFATLECKKWRHRGGGEQPDANNVYSHHYESPEHVSRAIGRKEKLDYQAKLVDGVIVIQDKPKSFQCTSDSLLIEMKDKFDSQDWKEGTLLIFEAAWCASATSSSTNYVSEASEARRIKSITWIDMEAHIMTENVDIWNAFELLDFKFTEDKIVVENDAEKTSRREQKKNNEEGQKKRDMEVTLQVSDPVVLSPSYGESYDTGEIISVEGYFPGYYGFETTISIWIRRNLLDTKVDTRTVIIDNNAYGRYSIEVLSDWDPSSDYYVYLDDFGIYGEEFKVKMGPKIAFFEPTRQSIYFPGNELVLKWKTSPRVSDTEVLKVGLSIHRKFQPDTDIASCSGTPLAGDEQFSCIVGNDWDESNYYYFHVSWDCLIGSIGCEKETSKHFTVRQNYTKSKISILRPTLSEQFTSEITVQWSYHTAISDLVVSIRRDRTGFDKVYETKSVSSLSGVVNTLSFPSASYPSNSKYYVHFEWDCITFLGWKFFCETVQSEYFSVNYQPAVVWYSPIGGEEILDSSFLASFAFSKAVTGSVYITLNENIPFGGSKRLTPVYPISTQDTSFTFDAFDKTVFPAHITISYNCLISRYFCDEDNSPQFSILEITSFSYNYDELTGRAIEENSISISCSDCPNDMLTEFCDKCDVDINSNVNLICSNCWMTSDVLISDVTLQVNLGGISSLSIKIDGISKINADLLLTLSSSFSASGRLDLTPNFIVTPFGYMFNILGVKFEFGLFYSVYLLYGFSAEGSARITAGADITVPFEIDLQWGDKFLENSLKVNKISDLVFNKHDPTFDLLGSAQAYVGIAPAVRLALTGIAKIETVLENKIVVDGSFQIPPFDPFEGNYKDSLDFYGECNRRHYLEYELYGEMALKVDVDILSLWNQEYIPFRTSISILSGCLLEATESSSSTTETPSSSTITSSSSSSSTTTAMPQSTAETINHSGGSSLRMEYGLYGISTILGFFFLEWVS